jgi:DNA/RNA endonuclease G (NUC1)
LYKQLFSLVILSFALLHQSSPAQADNSEIAAESASLKHFVNLFTIGGRPLNTDMSKRATILVNTGYVVGYSEDRRNPLWSAYPASKRVAASGQPARFERTKFFFADTRSSAAVDSRTFGGGFDRGHLTPNFAIYVNRKCRL